MSPGPYAACWKIALAIARYAMANVHAVLHYAVRYATHGDITVLIFATGEVTLAATFLAGAHHYGKRNGRGRHARGQMSLTRERW